MVEWISLAFNGLWVLGAAMILAAFSVSCYEAQRLDERLRVRLAAPGFQVPLALGLLLISLGMAMLGGRWWERALWGLFCATNAWQLWAAWHRWKMGDG
jgi:multisubunit Na+/H+ antiporter MnhB subunit